MTTANKPALRAWLIAHSACAPARDWVAAHPAPTVEACPIGEWLLWLAPLLGYPQEQVEAAVRPARLRVLRIHTPAALDAAGLHAQAAKLRSLPDDVELAHAAEMAREAAAAAWAAAAAADAARMAGAAKRVARATWATLAPWAAARAVAKAVGVWAGYASEESEHALCASDVRMALTDLQSRLDAALEERR